MADLRKPVRTLTDDQSTVVREAVHAVLLAATEVGAKQIGATGATFVVVGMGCWAGELAELDAIATAKYLRAMADIFDPKSNENKKFRAEKDRSQAVHAIYAALDLQMAETAGNG